MGFLGNPLKKIGGALSKLPGAKTLNKPINRALGKTPGLKGVPAKLGMAGPAKKPVGLAPSAPVVGAGLAGAVDQNKMGMQGAPMSAPQPPQMEAPEAVPGMMDQQAPPMPMQQPMEMQPQPQMQPPPPQMNDMMAKMRQRNTGVTGGRLGRYNQQASGIGPSFMG